MMFRKDKGSLAWKWAVDRFSKAHNYYASTTRSDVDRMSYRLCSHRKISVRSRPRPLNARRQVYYRATLNTWSHVFKAILTLAQSGTKASNHPALSMPPISMAPFQPNSFSIFVTLLLCPRIVSADHHFNIFELRIDHLRVGDSVET